MMIYWSIHSIPELAHLSRAERKRLWQRSLRAKPESLLAGLPGIVGGVLGSFFGEWIGQSGVHLALTIALSAVLGVVVGHEALARRRSQLIWIHEQHVRRLHRASIRSAVGAQRR